ncbi:hypothetical protein DYBT9623_02525 [Dyadobacter sp. CECT 9623]|uniref:DUF6973 domain-containing protein n=1 Tax=Dyadobacter linearis TaxID=2823330 RepID=A0ABM8UQJ8_9BACT|nr:hypothetical protein [Dyadobacter sp. CECT 9623]CAG5069788.1 hypothetical protein DYBT9623_02525 [Dyadobacter sp. CECT 9623]
MKRLLCIKLTDTLTFLNALFMIALTSTVFSCKEQFLQKSAEQPDPIELIDFKGETVIVPTGFPKTLFDQSPEEFESYYRSLFVSARTNTTAEMSILSFEELQPILQKCVERYPKITSDNIISENDLKRIFQDFPRLRTVEEVNSKRPVIFEYYQDLCKRDATLEVINYGNSDENLRTLSPGKLSDQEQVHLLTVPAYGLAYVNSGLDANSYTQSIYGNLADSKIGNAFRHAVWNAFAIRNILTSAPASENQAIDFVQDGTSKHEMNKDGQIHSTAAAMDLHNNMSARVWMEKKTSWGIGPFRKMPDYGEIIAEMKGKAAIAIFYQHLIDASGTINAILNAHGGNNATGWNNLYNNMYGPYEHLVHIE